MELYKGIEIVDLSLFLPKFNTLIITDTQLGYEESINKQGILLPRFQFKDILTRLEKIIKVTKPKKIIINGDLKHEFSTISKTEWKQVTELIDFISSKAELIVIEGNHDNLLEPILKKKSLVMKDHILIDDIYVCHGHKIQKNRDFEKAKVVIIGHEHPALGLREKGRVEKFKCFLRGKYKNKALIVMPSFNMVTEGTDILSEKLLSPFLKQNIDDFEVFVAGKEIMYFGEIKNILSELKYA
jgi:putative SbcD/Mre11-related phosphoesterase